MTFTYNTSSPSTRDRVRLKIGDVDATRSIFEDEEIDMALGDEEVAGNVLMAAASLCRTIACDAARQAAFLSLPGISVNRASVAQHFQELATQFERQSIERAAPDSVSVYTNDATNYDTITGRIDGDWSSPSMDE